MTAAFPLSPFFIWFFIFHCFWLSVALFFMFSAFLLPLFGLHVSLFCSFFVIVCPLFTFFLNNIFACTILFRFFLFAVIECHGRLARNAVGASPWLIAFSRSPCFFFLHCHLSSFFFHGCFPFSIFHYGILSTFSIICFFFRFPVLFLA